MGGHTLGADGGIEHDPRVPERPIRIVVPFTPGGSSDIMARALEQHLNGVWGQNVIIDNGA
jgi:tripartite-type tricarboxylate transporter receptor subunit TctC